LAVRSQVDGKSLPDLVVDPAPAFEKRNSDTVLPF
jgi:hypothetical protein